MAFNPEIHHRRSIRLRDYDYAGAGAYFVTICAYERECLFGDIVNGVVRLNPVGEIVRDEWIVTGKLRDRVVLDEFIVMPNHFHAVLMIDHVGATRRVAPGGNRHIGNRDTAYRANEDRANEDRANEDRANEDRANEDRANEDRANEDRATQRVAPTAGPASGSLGAIIGQFKSAATKRINPLRDNPGGPVWQRNYYERVIRDDRELDDIRRYIADNPAKWEEDENHPARQRTGA